MSRLSSIFIASLVLGAGVLLSNGARSQEAPQFDKDGQLMRPDPTGWPYVSASFSAGKTNVMAAEGAEEETKKEAEKPQGDFHVIQVNPAAFSSYAESGTFPEGTIFTMSFYTLDDHDLPGGRLWARDVSAMEVGVKDSARFDQGWAYFRFEAGADKASAFPPERCQACHIARGATDSVFTQLYSGLPGPD